MDYREGKKSIMDYVTDNGEIIEFTPDNVKQYYKELQVFDNGKKLAIRYPGYKTTKEKCDYCVLLVDDEGEKPITHVEIMLDLYGKTMPENYELMKHYVEDVAVRGLDAEVPQIVYNSGFSFQELTSLMFYIAIQEDINYQKTYFQGRKMCFYRYLEAVYCKLDVNHRLDEAIDKATARNYIPSLWNDVGDLYKVVSAIIRE